MNFEEWIDRIRYAVYPDFCIYCGKLVERKKHCCEACAAELIPIPVYAKPHPIPAIAGVDGLCAVYAYRSLSRQAVFRLKFSGDRSVAAPIADEMSDALQQYFWRQELAPQREIDCVIPVPMYPAQERKRGFNQSILLGRRIAKQLRVPFSAKILYKVKSTKKQHDLSDAQRRLNLEQAFSVRNRIWLRGKRVLLIDDVCTTGNTFLQCAAVLRQAGAKKIYAAAFLQRTRYRQKMTQAQSLSGIYRKRPVSK